MARHLVTDRERASVRSFLLELDRPSAREESPSELLAQLLERVPEPGAALGWLLAHEPNPTLREYAVLMLFTTAKDPGVPRRVRRPILKAAGPVLLRAFHDTQVDDEVKFMVGPALSLCGVEIPDDAYSRAFRDHEGTSRRMALEAFRSKPPVPEAVEAWLDGIELPDAKAFSHAFELGLLAVEANPPLGAMLLVTLALVSHERGIEMDSAGVLRVAAATQTGAALWMLRVAGELPATGPLGRHARRLAADLEAAGIEESVPDGGTFDEGHASGVDGAGSRQVVLLFRRSDHPEDRDCFTALVNDGLGLKDVFCVFREGAEVLQAFGEVPEISLAPCDVALARAIIADALAIHAELGRPVPGRFLLYRHFLGRDPLLPARRNPDLSAYALDKVRIGPELVARSRTLAHRPDCRYLYCASDRAYQFVARQLELASHEEAFLVLTDREMQGFIEEVVLEERPHLLRRLAVNLEVEARAGRAKRASNKRLAHLWLGLQHEVIPFADVPFVVELSHIGFDAVLSNVLQGYTTQAEANAAGMAGGEDEDEDHIPY